MADGRLSPFVYWAQTDTHITLKIDLRNVKSPDVHLSEDEIEFAATGLGARGQNEYHFVLEFFNAINPNESQYRVGEGQVEFNIKKRSPDSWPRLITNSQKPAWLKIDFEKWRPDADDEESEEMPDNPNGYKEFMDNYKPEKQLSGRNFTSHIQSFRKFYLCLYNLFHTFGYGFILVALILSYSKQGPESMKNAYQYVGWCMKLSQSLQVMDIVHRLLKYTKGSLKESLMQVGGRFVMLFIMIESEPRIQDKPVVFLLFCVWSAIDAIRYPYYMLRIYKYELSILTWLRYTIWIPLYPLGFLCEGAIILKNIPYFEETKKFSIFLPNKWNFSFHLPTLMRIYLLCFLFPACYVLMNFMYYQRKKKLGYPTRSIEKCD